MRGGSSISSLLRSAITRRTTSAQHNTSSSPPFRISPSSSTSSSSQHQSIFILNSSSSSQAQCSRRALSSTLRSQTNHNTMRAALACEASSLRYALLLSSEGDEALLRGWDDGVATEDDDGTWVIKQILPDCEYFCRSISLSGLNYVLLELLLQNIADLVLSFSCSITAFQLISVWPNLCSHFLLNDTALA